MKTKRALIRAVEKQADMSERMDLLKAELTSNSSGSYAPWQAPGAHSTPVATSISSLFSKKVEPIKLEL